MNTSTTRVFIRGCVSVSSSYATPINDDLYLDDPVMNGIAKSIMALPLLHAGKIIPTFQAIDINSFDCKLFSLVLVYIYM